MTVLLAFRRLIFPCCTAVCTVYGIWYVLREVFFGTVPFGILLIFGMIVTVITLRAPFPDPASVEAVVGRDPANEYEYVRGNMMKTVAHRGAGMDAPENSLIAFQLCKEKGCNAIEFDVTLSSDNIPIVFHDKTLDRMAGVDESVQQKNFEELQKLDISVNHAYRDRFINTCIPTLEQSVRQMLESGQHMFIDIKDNNTKMVDVILNTFETFPELYTSAVVSSFYPNIIYLIRRRNPKIVCSLAYRPYFFSLEFFDLPKGRGPPRTTNWIKHYVCLFFDYLHQWALPNITYYFLGLSIILLHKDDISGNIVRDWRHKGIRVMAWTVNTPTEKQYCAKTLKITYMTDTLTGESTTHLLSE